jgi:hypothetical protein
MLGAGSPVPAVGILVHVGRLPVAVAAVALTLAASASSAAAPARPTLRAVTLQPLVVRGTHFRPFERIKLFLTADVPASRTLKATRGGTFVARFPAVEVGRCDGFVLQAIGVRGSRAELERLTPDCTEP